MKMNKRAAKALDGSIQKWERIVAGTDRDCGSDNCPLCIEFAHNLDCKGCPVAKFANVAGCRNTPWMRWNKSTTNFHTAGWATTPYLKGLARKELNFLKSLRSPQRRTK